MDKNNSNQNFNPFRENETSAHVNFAAKSPSIMPTPVYDDGSSVGSSPALSNPTTTLPLSPSPLGGRVHESERYPNDKTEVYGPTFTAEDQYINTSSTPPATGALLSKGFVPPSEQPEEIQLYETSNQTNNYNFSSTPINHNTDRSPSPPEQSRVDIFMGKLKGYQPPKDYNSLEAGNNTRGLLQPMPHKQRGTVYKHLFGGGCRFAIFTGVSGVIMIGIFVYELIRNNTLTGSAIQTNPFNPMIGPNYMALINMGSKFVPCMRDIAQYPSTFTLGNCYRSTESTCTIEQVCGFGGFNGQTPSQGFRFFTSIFLHAGVVHILLNLITHFTTGSEIERSLGVIRYIILYLVSGIWGFVLSAVLAASMGCSGSLFGVIGYTVVEMIVQWKEIRHPGREFMKLMFVIIISLVLGLLPGLDNFAHIGGLIMGLLLGVLLAPDRRTGSRRAMMLTWIARIAALVAIIVLYAVFLRIFYTSSDLSTICPNCKYLSCLPVNGWCDAV